ncbi:MAG: D-alanyl-D-alanine carboxypeptidase/D-alanyl-D-alanine-endopeptidase [Proteobacteria bacterium]|nr:MAG: D-alanyl-D-alanine carboxypeptidase/D-alanyl-D-alanine-endopeptidase [Pseudomonadota bacterium]
MKIRAILRTLVCAAAVALPTLSTAQAAPPIYPNLPAEIQQTLRASGMSTWGMSAHVQAIGSPRPLISHNAQIARNPASVMKLLTAYVSLGVLGPNYRWPIEITTNGQLRNGVLSGNVYIKGYGAPDFDTAGLREMLSQLRRKGIHTIRGRLVFDDTFFNGPKIDPGAFDGKPYASYNAQPDALMFNERRSHFTASRKGNRIRVTTSTPAHNLKIVNRIKRARRSCRVSTRVKRGRGDAVTVTFSGYLARRCRSRSFTMAITDPANTMYSAIKRIWTKELKGNFNAQFMVGATPANVRPIYTHYSKNLAQLLPRVMKDSNNVMARQLMRSVGAKRFGAPGTPKKGAEAIDDYLRSQGLNFPELRIENGSGLSRYARISTQSVARLLTKAYYSPYRDILLQSMAVAGVDGTMKGRLRQSAVRGRGFFKTGTLRDVRGIAGYVNAADGRTYVVSILHNDPAARRRGRRIHDNFIEWVFWGKQAQQIATGY